jgi:hypothetical protein
VIARSAPPGLSGILEIKLSSAPEETMMMPYTTVQALGRPHLAELQRQAQHDALAREAREARRQQSGHRAPGILAALTVWAHRPRPTPESS